MIGLQVEFVEFDDDRKVRHTNDPWLVQFAAVLRKNSGRWAKWPKSLKAASSMAARINYPGRGNRWAPAPISAPEFEARTSHGILYVRHIGGKS